MTTNEANTTAATDEPETKRFVGFRPETVLIFVTMTCLFGLLWGLGNSNWALVAAEGPSVLALAAIWWFTRTRKADSKLTKAASLIGLLCAVELWVATTVFNLAGAGLLLLAATSSLLAGMIAMGYWFWWRRSAQYNRAESPAKLRRDSREGIVDHGTARSTAR